MLHVHFLAHLLLCKLFVPGLGQLGEKPEIFVVETEEDEGTGSPTTFQSQVKSVLHIL